MKITAETITDEQIRELRNALLKESDMQMTRDTDACGTAISDPSDPRFDNCRDIATWARAHARARCAEILNARKEGK